jgi:hypothetical protein
MTLLDLTQNSMCDWVCLLHNSKRRIRVSLHLSISLSLSLYFSLSLSSHSTYSHPLTLSNKHPAFPWHWLFIELIVKSFLVTNHSFLSFASNSFSLVLFGLVSLTLVFLFCVPISLLWDPNLIERMSLVSCLLSLVSCFNSHSNMIREDMIKLVECTFDLNKFL